MSANSVLASFRNRILEGENTASDSWSQELEQLYKNGIGLDEALQYLYFERPSVADFEKWVIQKSTQLIPVATQEEKVLSESELQFFETNGYLVLKKAISKEDCLATQQIIWEFLGMQPNNPASWYVAHPEQKGLMVNFFEHPQLEKNRASARIRKAYEQLYQTENIYKTIDKVSFNPPITPYYTFKGSALHWDVSLQQPIPFRLQGLIYLSECGPNDGAFHCVPGFHHSITDWINQVPEGKDIRAYALEALQPVPITGEAGDMVIWHQALPHCAKPNYGATPRMVQYLTYFGENYQEPTEWI
ncbi:MULTISPECIES: phytanoyl-CoA dioxygenase family protein [Flavobacterium]|uniref:Phytanoyl-CoA dioxygenase n=1 Tax=Flavobacterium hankyongi TaxID=1176532 RepID=A0ABP9A8U6_9FLAO|nr:phytanoyl-CoA dioxygenase family protein [Flavobacterium sp. N1846]